MAGKAGLCPNLIGTWRSRNEYTQMLKWKEQSNWMHIYKMHIHKTNKQIRKCVKEMKSLGLLQTDHLLEIQGLDHVSNEKTSKFAESFCKSRLDIVFWYHKLVGLGRLNALPHLTSITKKHNNGMYIESSLGMNNRNMTYHVLSYSSYSNGSVEEVQS